MCLHKMGFPGGSDGKESTHNAEDLGTIPGSGRFPGGGHGNPLQYSCLKNPVDRGAWQTTAQVIAKSQTRLSDKAQHTIIVFKENVTLRLKSSFMLSHIGINVRVCCLQ